MKKIVSSIYLIANLSLQSAAGPAQVELEPPTESTEEEYSLPMNILDNTSDKEILAFFASLKGETMPITASPQNNFSPQEDFSPKVRGEKKAKKNGKKRTPYRMCPFPGCGIQCSKGKDEPFYEHLMQCHDLNTSTSTPWKHNIQVCHMCQYAAVNSHTFFHHIKQSKEHQRSLEELNDNK